MNWLEVLAYIALGLFAGTYGTLVGVGGGLFLVPALIFFAHLPPKEAAGTSMAVVLANAASGSFSYLRQRRVALRTGVVFAAAGLPGALLGGYIDQLLPRAVLGLLLGIFLLILALRLLLQKPQPGSPADVHAAHTSQWSAVLIAVGAGFIASMFGVGGGIMYVPLMLYVLRYAPHIATATSTFTIALTALLGTASHAYFGDIHYAAAAMLAVGAIAGAQIGVLLSTRIQAAPLVRLFAAAVLASALWLIYRAVH
ncbi:MAG: sulfite exporter TauE/SafE family protein [Candidatus Eremiobacteraeota bacterium]|nr:sulfite exporter TauE/SafE family protein [Candidatus Eremiobacteraeota bacterium]